MRLNKLIIHGFKSFAEHVEISFEQGVTGVVGPNGCGKSNISDAVRWVLGEQSAKALRGAHMEDVIFNGTETRRRLAFCEVSLIFDNTDHSLALDYAEVQVTRRMYRSGESEYSLNGTTCRRSDVIELFRDTGVGKEGYSIIGQGRIDEILSAKSEDRRLVFEEAAGVMKYKTRKTDAERKIDHTRANMERVEDILGELESRIEPLRLQSEAAREYIALRDEQKKLELNAFLVRTEKWTARLSELHQHVDSCAEELLSANKMLEEATEEREKEAAQLETFETDAAEKSSAVQEAIQAFDSLEADLAVAKERQQNAGRDQSRLAAQLEIARGGGEAAMRAAEELARVIGEEEASIASAREELASLSQNQEKLDDAVLRMAEEVENEEQRLIDDMNSLSDAKSREAALTSMQTAISAQIERLEADVEREEAAGEALREQVESEKRLSDNAKALAEEAEAAAREAEDAVREAAEKGEEARRRLTEKGLLLNQSESRIKLLREMQRDFEGYQNSVKQVLLMARRIQNSGVHGVVADLLHVPQKLERALDMALGAALQNIVVDRDEDAKRMIEYLRQNRFGRATFLPIGSVRGRTLSDRERQVLAMPGCVGLASELVGCDRIYQGVVDSLLGRTVIADNLEHGIAIQRAGGYQFRLVTLDGDVMHSGGSMTGGSVQSRATSLLSRTREIDSLSQAIERITREIGEIEDEMTRLEDARQAARRARTEMNEELTSRRIAFARAEEQYSAAQAEAENHAGRVARIRAGLDQLFQQMHDVEEELRELTDARENAHVVSEDRQAEVARLQAALADARRDAQAASDAVTERRIALATLEKGLEASCKEHDRLIRSAHDSETAVEEAEKALAESAESLARATEREAELTSLLVDAKEILDSARRAFREADSRRSASSRRIQEIASAQDEVRIRIQDLGDRHHRSELQLTRLESDLKQMTDRIWEDYTMTLSDAESFREPDFKLQESDRRVAEIKNRVKALGSVNVSALDEYRETLARVEDLTGQHKDLEKAEEDLRRIIQELESRMEKRFRERFQLIDEHFQRIFVSLFGGGRAELRLADPKEALTTGIEIVAQPPGKKLQSLSLLSGGERALTAIALLFAILEINPSPFCILDEIEAALDDANIDNFAEFLRDYSRRTQFVVITHRKGTMERCNALYGVVMEEKGVSKTVSVSLGEAVRSA